LASLGLLLRLHLSGLVVIRDPIHLNVITLTASEHWQRD
jgi:hypothetical protein